MAYSDYGGYAFKNGAHVESRSDWTLTPDGGVGTPGTWGGFAMAAAGKSAGEVLEFISYPQYHAALGDGPFFVGLYKQSAVTIHTPEGKFRIDDLDHDAPDAAFAEYNGSRYLNAPDGLTDLDRPVTVRFDGHILEVYWRETDNYYVFARLTQPDGAVWTGFSGYGVGAGFEDGGYGFSTEDVIADLSDLFPPAP